MAGKSVVTLNLKTVVDGKEQVTKLTADLGALGKAAQKVQRQLSRNRWQETVTACASLNYAITSLTDTMSGATAEYKSFKDAMLAANTMAGKRGEEFERLKEQVTELGKSIPLAREALANGLYQVISNGVPEDNWISYLEASARSAVGGIADVGEVVKVTSTIIKNYGLSWDSAMSIQDKIQLTAKNGVTSFEQLAAALPSVTGQAAQLGVSLDEMLAVMSTLTGVTGNTSEVSTQLASVLTALTKESTKAQKMAAAMGIEFNAAGIKAAGGLRNFLIDLDRTVTAYTQKTGDLKESVYSKLFGRAEALRLVNALSGELAAKFEENIAVMANSAGTIDEAFGEVAQSSASKAQLMKNKWAEAFDFIGSAAAKVQPYLNFTAPLFMSISGITALSAAVKGLMATTVVYTTKTKLAAVATLLFGTNARNTTRLTWMLHNSLNMTASAAKKAAVSIRGLMTATGVGAAIVALAYAFNALAGTMEKTDAASLRTKRIMEDLTRINDEHKKSLEEYGQKAASYAQEEKTRLDLLYNTAKNATKSNEERISAIKKLQNLYPDYFKNVSTELGDLSALSTAYEKLAGDIYAAAEARAAFENLVDIEKQLQLLNEDEKELRSTAIDQQKALDKARAESNATQKKPSAYAGYGNASTVATSSPVTSANASSGIKVQKAQNALNETTTALSTLSETKLRLEKKKKSIKETASKYTLGVENTTIPETTDTGDDDDEKNRKAEESEEEKAAALQLEEILRRKVETLADYDKVLSDLRLKQKYVSKDEYASIGKSIEAIEKERDTFIGAEKKKTDEEIAAEIDVAAVMAKKRNNINDIDKAIEQLDLRQKYANAEEAAQIEQYIKQLREEKDSITRIKPASIDKLNTQKDLSEAIQYYEAVQQKQSGKELYDTQKLIIELKKKENTIEDTIALMQKIADVNEIASLPDKEITAKIKSMGFEGLSEQIREMEKALNKLDLPDDLRKELTDTISTLKQWRRESVRGFDTYREGYTAIKSTGSAIKQTINTLQGSGDAWDKVTAAIDGMLTVYDGVQGIIKLIGMFKVVNDAAAISSTAAAAANVAAAGETAAAAGVETAATKVETASYLELLTAKYLAAHASIPIAGFGIGSGYAASAAAMVKAAGAVALAKGGIATGPTMALVGEYSGAGSNPEVIAPLDKLRGMLGAGVGDGSGYPKEIMLRERGREMAAVLRREERRKRR